MDAKNKKIIRLVLLIIFLLLITLLIGIIGYRYYFNMSWTDAVYNATISASTLGLDPHERTDAEKIFTGFYAIFTGVFIISLISSITAYVFTIYIDNEHITKSFTR